MAFNYKWCEPLYRLAIKRKLKEQGIPFDVREDTESLEEKYHKSIYNEAVK